MLSITFSVLILLSFLCAVLTGNLANMSSQIIVSLSDGVNLCISILGMMCFWSGIINVLKDAGVLNLVSKILKPVLCLIYGKQYAGSHVLDTLSASVSANFLGLGNAALPLGIKVMKEFDCYNKDKNTVSDEMIMFSVLNTVPFQLVPSTLIAIRSKYGGENPFDILPATWIASIIINIFAVILCKLLSGVFKKRRINS